MKSKLCFGDFSEHSFDFFSSENEMPAQVKLPEFWPMQAALWFARADAEFVSKAVTVEQTKYAHVVAALPVEVAARVSDEILSPDGTHPYQRLRQRLLDTYTLDEFQRFCGLVDMPARPSDRPSALLDAMFAFLPEGVSREDPGWMFKNLFLRRLPAELCTLLMPHKSETVRQLATRGDELWSGMRAATPVAAHVVDVDTEEPSPSLHAIDVQQMYSLYICVVRFETASRPPFVIIITCLAQRPPGAISHARGSQKTAAAEEGISSTFSDAFNII